MAGPLFWAYIESRSILRKSYKAVPMEYAARLIAREKLAAEVTIFRIEKPEGFRFLAGQYCLVSVPDMGFNDDRGLRRLFSIVSSPLELESCSSSQSLAVAQ